MVKVLKCNSKLWENYLHELPSELNDVYYTPDYYNLYEKNGDGSAYLFIYEDKNNLVLYPFLLRRINNEMLNGIYYDIETVYGYGGPVSNSMDTDFLTSFENAFLLYCKQSNIVAEFIRFHPLLRNENIFKQDVEILHNRYTVYLDLSKEINIIWNDDIKSKNRNMIRKAEKLGLKIDINKDYDMFQSIYNRTMDRVNANNYYYFNQEYFNCIKRNENYILLNAVLDDKTIASAIFIQYGDYFHYHLSGSLKEYLNYSPNNLILWEAIKIACERRAKCFHFGGGLTDSKEDSLFKFKNSFSKQYADFYIGKRIHNKQIYSYLIDEWEEKNNKKAVLFLQYRY